MGNRDYFERGLFSLVFACFSFLSLREMNLGLGWGVVYLLFASIIGSKLALQSCFAATESRALVRYSCFFLGIGVADRGGWVKGWQSMTHKYTCTVR
ncbi:hypothetical protein BDV12DRAFT_166167 [Aspergillus spectabilis]